MRRMDLKRPVILVILSLSVVYGAASKCIGWIGFSSSGAKSVHPSGLIKFNVNFADSGHGWVSDTGTFTVQCPGTYHISYMAYGDPKTRVTLHKRGATNAARFEPIISTPPGGGAVTVIVSLKMAEQIAMIVAGALRADVESPSLPVTAFSAHKIAD